MKGKAVALHNHSVDFSGVAIDVRKSDVQKAIRRGLTKQAIGSFIAGFELVHLFPESDETNEHRVAKSVQTNFINRLIVILVEDVGLANPRLVKYALPVLFGMSTGKRKRDLDTLCGIIVCMCESEKSRLCSHLFHAFKKTEKTEITLEDPSCFSWLVTKDPEDVFSKILCKELSEYKTGFLELRAVYKKSSKFGKPNVIRYALGLGHYLLEKSEKGDFVRAEMQKPFLAIVPFRFLGPLYPCPLVESVDIHTKAGRKAGSTVKRFKQEGAQVENASKLMNDPVLEDFYNNN